jgi:3-oxoacyl-(acyl-carrier-protein) synthase
VVTTYIVMIKRGETSFGFSCGSGSEAVAMALRLLRNGDVDVSITSPRNLQTCRLSSTHFKNC